MSEEAVESHLFDDRLHNYEEKLVEIILNIGKSKRVNPKVATIACYLLIHKKLTQKELKKLTGFSMGTISTYLSVMAGTGYFLKQRLEGTHTFIYSFSGELEVLTTQAIEFAIKHIGFLEKFLENKKQELKKLIEQSKEGAEHFSLRIEELLNSFEIYKNVYPSESIPTEEIQKKYSPKSFERLKSDQKEMKEIKYDPDVYIIEDEIINELIGSPMFSTKIVVVTTSSGFTLVQVRSPSQFKSGPSSGTQSKTVILNASIPASTTDPSSKSDASKRTFTWLVGVTKFPTIKLYNFQPTGAGVEGPIFSTRVQSVPPLLDT